MRKEDIQEYLSDEALEALIRETEEGPMIKAPEYFCLLYTSDAADEL